MLIGSMELPIKLLLDKNIYLRDNKSLAINPNTLWRVSLISTRKQTLLFLTVIKTNINSCASFNINHAPTRFASSSCVFLWLMKYTTATALNSYYMSHQDNFITLRLSIDSQCKFRLSYIDSADMPLGFVTKKFLQLLKWKLLIR